MKTLIARRAEAFEGRGNVGETAFRFGILTGERQPSEEVAPDPDGKIVAFPFIERGAVVC